STLEQLFCQLKNSDAIIRSRGECNFSWQLLYSLENLFHCKKMNKIDIGPTGPMIRVFSS
ncbi:hypothetical protein L9F63_010284, partial [Diploptera punctata]